MPHNSQYVHCTHAYLSFCTIWFSKKNGTLQKDFNYATYFGRYNFKTNIHCEKKTSVKYA